MSSPTDLRKEESLSSRREIWGESFKVTIVTPTGLIRTFDVRHLRAPGSEGDFGVLPGHLPFMTTLRVGALYLDTKEGRARWAISGGFAQVLSDH
ncbi:MAG: F0F1 ATP synthase subunit epsilon, partial [bacterium]